MQRHFLTVPSSWCHQVNIILGAGGGGPIVQGHFLIVPTPAEESLIGQDWWLIRTRGAAAAGKCFFQENISIPSN